ncbi:DNA-binding response regulator [Leptospira kobayashii]|uniref:DNA-binding response regulator n=1 Tax=Leptospira kobayashii TaxID=1917830 RepID=A0ABM7UIF4_9LEPT|nr:response regulator transcription factor [Leptospira kobayashii]BDA78518.1 DNA-binding response regulator [Leptospira kobayashii]
MIRFYLIDDHPAIRKGIQSMIQNIPDFSLVGEASSAEEAIADFSFKKIDILISDMILPGQNGLVIFEKIKALQPHAKVIFITMMKDWDMVKKAYLLGADGYILKDSDSEYIEASVKEIIAGKKVFPDGMVSILPLGSEWEDTRAKLQDLSKREKEILELIAKGNLNREIAEKLGISIRTVEGHRSNLIEKLNLNSAQSLVRFAAKVFG